MVDGTYTLVFKFSEQYFEEAGQKLFHVRVGEKMVLQNVDPVAMAGAKLLPFDAFVELKTKRGEVFINGDKVKSAVRKENLVITFELGSADNPKINAIALVKGGVANTHKGSYDKYRQTMHDMLNEKAEAKAKEE